MNNNPETVVVTRHEATIEYLRKLGYVPGDAKIIAHATADDVRGKTVVGMLPYNLASLAECVVIVDMDIPQELRGVDLNVQQVEKYAQGISTYVVIQIEGGD